jgi:eukaryotic-like serine/threonine-protein kinase
MTLAVGTKLGPYEIVAPIGAGGMGEVYRARDPRLGRDVAIKILPAHYLSDPERLERFQREARAAAATNYPNVVAIYDIGTSEGVPFIACELLTGVTLRAALTPGVPWSTRKALDVAQQIARGLAAAHARGVVHRDLKPENVFLAADGVVKILDFGLARLKETPAFTSQEDATVGGTEPGRVLGTVGYMAPEQVRGHPADHRADIFAFGAIVYEMLAGCRAFMGESAADVMTAILTMEPAEIAGAAHPVPPALERIVTRCLDKRPEGRFQSASDLAFALESTGSTAPSGLSAGTAGVPTPARRRRLIGIATVAAAVVVGAMLEARFASMSNEAKGAMFIDIALPSGPEILRVTAPVLSDDGRRMAVSVTEQRGSRLWIGSLDAPGFSPVPGTEGTIGAPFWSPDGRQIGFMTGGDLKTVDLTSSAVKTLAHVPMFSFGEPNGAWSPGNDIVLTVQGVFQLRSGGGVLAPLVMPDPARDELFLGNPQVLPDRRHYLFTVFRGGLSPQRDLCVGALGTRERRSILQLDSFAGYAAPGYLLFTRGGTLFAQRFDVNRLALSGAPERIAGGLQHAPSSLGRSFGSEIGASQAGSLFYETGLPEAYQFTWFDRTGRESGRVGHPVEALAFDVAPDGASAVAMIGLPGSLWRIDMVRGEMSRLTGGSDDADPRLSVDGKTVLYGGTYGGRRGIDRVSLEGGARTRLYEAPEEHRAPRDPLARLNTHDWSRDGRFVLCDITGFSHEISTLTLGDGLRQVVIQSSGHADQARFSPDGRWIAYNDIEAGRFEVFVVPFPPTGERWQISTSGGVQPEWRGDGRELFYLDLSSRLMAVEVQAKSRFHVSDPRPLFQTRLEHDPAIEAYRVTADGQRFLLRVPVGGSIRTTLVMNWPALLKP